MKEKTSGQKKQNRRNLIRKLIRKKKNKEK